MFLMQQWMLTLYVLIAATYSLAKYYNTDKIISYTYISFAAFLVVTPYVFGDNGGNIPMTKVDTSNVLAIITS